jgi:hypothetical protein
VLFKKYFRAKYQCLTLVILVTQEAEIRKWQFKVNSGKQFVRPYLENNPSQKKGWWSDSRHRP